MCGIAGFFSTDPVSRLIPERMLDALRRRGPDAQHQVLWNAAFGTAGDQIHNALLHARLSIIDPRPLADQPMVNDAGDIWISYNGEVYDWKGDADELRGRGLKFRTRSDTEFILKAYETWGIEFLSRLRGMFAIAILDLRTNQVWLIRDRMGLKPIVYSHIGGNLAFGSTLRSVLPFLPADRRGFSGEGIDAYLAHRYIPAPRTIFEHVRRLENGHWLKFDLKTRQIETRRYWNPRPQPAQWQPLLDEAIAIRTVADRPLGVFLSSGIDSSVIASCLSRSGKRDIRTFTAAFPGSSMDESREAGAIAEVLGLPNFPIDIPGRISGDFERIVADLDEPFADPSSMPTWYLARETTKHVKVVLGGDGGDELFGGYKRVEKHLRSRWRRHFKLDWLSHAADPRLKGWRKWSSELRMSWLESYSLRFSGFTPGQRLFLQPDRGAVANTYWRFPETGTDSPVAALLALDRENYLPEYILRKADLCTMAHGLELRAPLLDHLWFQALLAVPENLRFTRPPKLFLRPACAELNGIDLFHRKKRGFNPPLAAWLGVDLADRFQGLGERLGSLTGNQMSAGAITQLVTRYRGGYAALAEQMLQLLILDESLRQLDVLRRDLAHA
ncbi:MAG TPA: asparagine synthase (glutamine-hydrolyzing) [Burkholderiales bacterium]|jgi:asparagine synthase (glutamine-hydrolysing)